MQISSDFQNPYSAPRTFPAASPPPHPLGDVEAIRREHIGTEASIKSLGILYFLGSFFFIMGGIGGLTGALLNGMARKPQLTVSTTEGAFLIAFGLLFIALGRQLRKLSPSGRTGAAILSGLGLLGFPVGTLICAIILSTLLGKKGTKVFSPEYKEVIAATPHVKNKTSPIVWIVIAVLFILPALLVGGLVIMGGMNR